MKATIPGKYVKLFAKALGCIQRIGNEALFEIVDDGLNIQSLNQARSAFVIFRFSKRFFGQFRRTTEAYPKFQVPIKSLVGVFRTVASVESCDISIDEENFRLNVVMHCKLSVEKRYQLSVEESAAHKAIYNRITPHRIISRARTLQDCVANFQNNVEEVTLVPHPQHLRLKTYVDDTLVPSSRPGSAGKDVGKSVLMTELVVDAQDFDQYAVQDGAGELTFSLKELRAILQFCEAAGQPISVFFSDPGQPILWSVNCFDALQVEFVLATLATVPVPDASQSGVARPSQQPLQQPADKDNVVGAQPVDERNSSVSQTQMRGARNANASHSYSRGHSPPPNKRDDDDDDDDDDDGNVVEGTPERELKKARHSTTY